jgi:hypothetical protein
MADEDLLIRLTEPPKRSVLDTRRANALSLVAIIISALAALFTGLQWREARQNRLSAHAPLLEVTKAEFVIPSTLVLTVHNIGRSPALSLKSRNDAYIGTVGILSSQYSRVFVRAMASYMKSIPPAQEAQVGVYMPEDDDVKKVILENRFPPQIVIELRGQVTYRDDYEQEYALPFCYVAMQVKPLPAARECTETYDDILRQLK